MIILKISNLSKHHLDTLNIFEKNYLTWVVDAEMYLALEENKDIIK